MYKRVPASMFDSFEDIYDSMINFMLECGFTIVATGGIGLGTSSNVKKVTVLKDPITIHNLVLIHSSIGNRYVCSVYIIDEYIPGNDLDLQGNIAKTHYFYTDSTGKEHKGDEYCIGVLFCYYDHDFSHGRESIVASRSDLICMYNNRTLVFVSVPTKCYVYSHIYDFNSYDGYPTCGSILIYGNFTKYHISNIKDCVFLTTSCNCSTFGPRYAPFTGTPLGKKLWNTLEQTMVGTSTSDSHRMYTLVFCYPEASYNIGRNTWFCPVTNRLFSMSRQDGENPPLALSCFDYTGVRDNFRCVDYISFWSNSVPRDRLKTESQLNNSSILQPLIIYGAREPMYLKNWSAIGESKLINLVSMNHSSSGDIFIDTGVEHDYHKYFTFHALTGGANQHDYTFEGLAVEIYAKENLLHKQSLDYLEIELNDSFRNFDRYEIEFENSGSKFTVEWVYDDFYRLYDSDGVFNLTRDNSVLCMVYGLSNSEGNSTDFKLTCSESCKIISIIGYRGD